MQAEPPGPERDDSIPKKESPSESAIKLPSESIIGKNEAFGRGRLPERVSLVTPEIYPLTSCRLNSRETKGVRVPNGLTPLYKISIAIILYNH